MFKGYNGNWTEQPAIFVGEATTNANNVTGTITYSLNGRCHIKGLGERGEGIIENNTINISKLIIPHFIGTEKVNIDYWAYQVSANQNYLLRSEKVKPYSSINNTVFAYPVTLYDRNYLSLNEGTYGFVFVNTNTFSAFIHQHHVFDWEFIVERSF
jgi:hypothetical protein